MRKQILVIDGQGGKLGRSLIEAIRGGCPDAEITAVGTNGIATAAMSKAKPDHLATGENSVVVCSRTADVVIGPIGIVIADSMLGEITPAMLSPWDKARRKSCCCRWGTGAVRSWWVPRNCRFPAWWTRLFDC